MNLEDQISLTDQFIEYQLKNDKFLLGRKDAGFALTVLHDFITFLNENGLEIIDSEE